MDTQKEQYYKEQLIKATQRIRQLKTEVEQLRVSPQNEPIAIVGMACRFPGGVVDLDSYWDLLKNKVDAITEIPSSRWNTEKYYAPEVEAGKMYCRKGGFIEGIENFDAAFFDISPREAITFDPSFRLLLEVCHEAFENAGFTIEQVKDTLTSVMVGQAISDYEHRHLWATDLNKIDAYSATGAVRSTGSGRVSFLYDLQGANVSLETGCSASLVGIHLSAQILRNGEVDLAIVGGTNVNTQPNISIALCQMSGLSEDGYCKTFDESANGFVPADGTAVIILKRLSDAIKDKNHVWALIRGSAINHVGRSNGPTAPSTKSQIKLIQQALRNAQLKPEVVDFVEAHGTGTPLGDPIEMEAIQQTYGKTRTAKNPIVVGSVKTNIGHTEGAAGLAGLIKAVLAIQHKQIPANLHFHTPSPHINWDGKVKIPTEMMEWKKEGLRVAATSSFGMGGTNAHVIVEEVSEEIRAKLNRKTERKGEYDVLSISAKTPQALKAYAQKYIDFLQNRTELSFTDICAAAATSRTHFTQRLAIVANEPAQAIQQLQAFIGSEAENTVTLSPDEEAKVVFVFSGQGSHWVGMGKTLYAQSVIFKQTIDECEKAFSRFVDWSLVAELHKPESENRFKEMDVIQPVLFAIEVALAKLWLSMGIKPDAVVGHSLGEIAAAYIANILSLEDATQVIYQRSFLMKKLSGKGKVLLVELTIEQAQEVIKNYTHQVSIALSNSPQSTVLSGDTEAIEAIKKNLEEKSIFCRLVKTDVAFHSLQMDIIKEPLLKELSNIKPQSGNFPFYSTVHEGILEGGNLGAKYWVDNVREPVMFGRAVEQLLVDGHTVFIEISPHPVLLVPIQQIIEAGEWKAIAIPSLYRDKPEMQEFSQSIAKLYMGGYPLDWSKTYPSAAHIFLPTYPWQKKRYWIEPEDHITTNSSEKQSIVLQEKTEAVLSFADQIRQLSAKEQEEKLKQVLKEKISTVAGIPIGEIGLDTPFKNMGVDSLMFIQLRNVLKKSIGLEVNVKEFMQNPTVTLSTRFILSKLGSNGNSEQTSTKNTHLSSHTWFDVFQPRPKAAFRVFCFHFAGGSSSLYFPWNKLLHKDIELVAVQMPNRMGDKNYPYYTMEQITQALTEAMQDKLDKPYFFFGHSMGGTVLFELCRELRRKGKPLPTQLFISANPYRNEFEYIDADKLSKQELQQLFPRLGLEGIDDESFHEMLMAILRQDLKALHSHRYVSETPLNIPIKAIHAKNDAIVKLSQVQGWEAEAQERTFELIIREGDHDYIHEDTAFLVGLLNEVLVFHLNKQT